MRSLLTCLLLLAVHDVAAAQLIAIDPGHGGGDPGAVGCGREEEDAVLDTSLRLQTLLVNEGFTVVMTRSDDRDVSLGGRTSLANSRGADRFVSIHANANAGTPATGTETFVSESASGASVDLQGHVQREMIAAWGLRDRGSKRANFYVLRNTSMPATLSEMGFINNCGIDSPLLGNPARLQEMAQAHFNAIMAHYGRDPGDPPTGTGTLRGVVFEDVGAGLEDTTRRLAGATVSAGGMSTTSAAETGNWSFTLPAGSITVTANLAGFREGSRTCDLTSGGETWCSVGLVREMDPPPMDAGPPEEDAGSPGTDAGSPSGTDAGPAIDGGSGGGVDAGGIGPMGMDRSVGCQAGGGAHAGWLALLGLLLLARRRHGLALVALGAVACAGSGEAAATRAPLTQTIELATEAPDRLLRDVHTIAGGPYVAVESAPSTGVLAASLPGYLGVDLLHPDGHVQALARGERRGFAPVWSEDGAQLGVRVPGQTETAAPMIALDLDGREVAPVRPRELVRVSEDGAAILLEDGTRIAPPGDQYFAPRLSADGHHVVFRGASTGLYLHDRRAGRTVQLGAGEHARFSPDGRWLVFARVEDDGHHETAGDLFVVDVVAGTVARLTDTVAIERAPTIDAEGRVSFVREGAVLRGTM